MPTADCRLLRHGRIMRCLSCLLLLPDTLRKSKKLGALPARLPLPSYDKHAKMAAELCAANNGGNPASGTTVADADKTATKEEAAVTARQAAGGDGGPEGDGGGGRGAAATAGPTDDQRNVSSSNNNTAEPRSWQGGHPTLRERCRP